MSFDRGLLLNPAPWWVDAPYYRRRDDRCCAGGSPNGEGEGEGGGGGEERGLR